MVYQNRLVACIKVNGQILRESDNTVSIPFGSEYSILIKNLNAVRAQVKVSVDGTDVTSNTWLVVNPNGSLELERFIRDGNWDAGNRFKFIERTKEIESHRGIKADDGLVRIEYQVERVQPVVDVPIPCYYNVPVPRPYYPPCPTRWPFRDIRPGIRSGMRRLIYPPRSASMSSRSLHPMSLPSASAGPRRAPVTDSARRHNDAGITVPGSCSEQKFVSTSSFATGNSEVIVLHLRGIIAGKAVVVPVTVKTKLTCTSCGKINKADSAFCSKCGTALSMI